MAPRCREPQQLAAVVAVIPQFGPNLVAFLNHVEDITSVLAQGARDVVDIAGELIVASKLRSQRSAEAKVGLEHGGDQGLVGLSPQVLEEEPDHVFLRRQRQTFKSHGGFMHGCDAPGFAVQRLALPARAAKHSARASRWLATSASFGTAKHTVADIAPPRRPQEEQRWSSGGRLVANWLAKPAPPNHNPCTGEAIRGAAVGRL